MALGASTVYSPLTRMEEVKADSFSSVIETPIGRLGMAFNKGGLSALSFLSPSATLKPPQDHLSCEVENQLNAYFENPSHCFTLPLHLSGSAFQQQVWHALQAIPPGETLTYGALAKHLATGARAIGQACRTNPIPIIVPCHRIIAAQNLGGYSGERCGKLMNCKKWLLEHEGSWKPQQKSQQGSHA